GRASAAGGTVFGQRFVAGDGVFEGIPPYQRRVLKLERPVERLFDSAKAIRLEIPASRDDVAELVLEACRRNAIVDGYIRLVVTRGAGDLGIDPRSCPRPDIIAIAKRVATLYGQKPWHGISVGTSAFRRHPADVLSPAL